MPPYPHFQPSLEEQGHSGYAWSILGAAAYATERIGLMSYVTCPTLRYHPAIVAQKAATVQIPSFITWGTGATVAGAAVTLTGAAL